MTENVSESINAYPKKEKEDAFLAWTVRKKGGFILSLRSQRREKGAKKTRATDAKGEPVWTSSTILRGKDKSRPQLSNEREKKKDVPSQTKLRKYRKRRERAALLSAKKMPVKEGEMLLQLIRKKKRKRKT